MPTNRSQLQEKLVLLRRVIEHTKAQNWTAVAIDLVIVVVGVFIGVQVSNWNDTVVERKTGSLILERLRADFDDIVGKSESALSNHQRNLDGLQLIIETIDRGALDDERADDFRKGLRFSYTHTNAVGRSATYSELLASGKLSLVENEDLRKALIAYDDTVDESADVFMQIRMHQSAHIESFTRHYSYAIPAYPLIEGDNWQPVADFDLDAMLSDRDFKNAAHELREAQRYYFNWHLRTRNRAKEVRGLLIHEAD
jgi:hypothetical protein